MSPPPLSWFFSCVRQARKPEHNRQGLVSMLSAASSVARRRKRHCSSAPYLQGLGEGAGVEGALA